MFRPVSDARYWFSQFQQEAFRKLLSSKRPAPKAPVLPPCGALFLKDGGVIDLDYADPKDSVKIQNLANDAVDGIVWRNRTTGTWVATVRWGESMGITAFAPTKEEAYGAACTIRTKKKAEEARIQSDPLLLLERALSRHDWWHAMADSYGTCASGERQMDEIRTLAKSLPPEDVRKLWAKHAPLEFGCPV